ncbi:MAG: hypothetical protein WCP39_08270, partial [Chlamydiota bacterium]
LVPGKQLSIEGTHSLRFFFVHFPEQNYFICEHLVLLPSEKEILLVQKNISQFLEELRINILAVHHARSIASMQKLSSEQQSALIQEHISSLLIERGDGESSPFDEMQNFLIKISSEKKLSQIQENISILMNRRPEIFDRDIFENIHHISLLFKSSFTFHRGAKHVSRIIGFQYLLKRSLKQTLIHSPKDRFFFFKLMKTELLVEEKTIPVLSLLFTLNFLTETERLEKKHILEAITNYIPEAEYVENSYIVDTREEKIPVYYIECKKNQGKNFTFDEIKLLRKSLTQELKNRIENIATYLFMPRNEEEILHNVVTLSKQIKYVWDIPQVMISYEKQSGQEILFTVLLVRIIKTDTPTIKDLFSQVDSTLHLQLDEVKNIGHLKKKHPKEVNIFKVGLKKFSFIRQDNSLDIQKARHSVVLELMNILGDFRDYNGGMMAQQNQALEKLKGLLSNEGKNYEFLIENFFYSLKPAVMQSILDPEILKNFFFLFLEMAKKELYEEKTYFLMTKDVFSYFLVVIGSKHPTIKDEILNGVGQLKIPSLDLA